MNREIKFRVWCEERNTMSEVCSWNFLTGYIENDGPEADNEFEELIPMQFTGLKDKNGKEIYEGDIVQSKDWHSDTNGRYVISDENSYMRKRVIKYSTIEPFVGFTIPSKCEVIGNIYEHPELLKETSQ